MVRLPSGKKSPYQVLGVPSYASAHEIRAAYLKRVKMLKPYRFDKVKQPLEWQAVNEVMEELNDAYARLRPPGAAGSTETTKLDEIAPTPPPEKIDSSQPALSHRENTERAIQDFQKLATELDGPQSKEMFIRLIAGRGFTESQILPSPAVISARLAESAAAELKMRDNTTDSQNATEDRAKSS